MTSVPGTHNVVTGGVSDALAARRAGWQLRDTILVMGPGRRVQVAFLFRHPPEGSIAANVLHQGVGGLNIDACRVGSSKRVPASPRGMTDRVFGTYRAQTGNESGYDPNLGRFPPNILLVHTPGCRCDGTKRVAGDMAASRGSSRFFGIGQRSEGVVLGYTDESGLETVDAWTCSQDCPIQDLDEQSRERGMHPAGNKGSFTRSGSSKGYRANAYGTESRPEGTPHPFYADDGGASRFYPQLTDMPAAHDWLDKLTGQACRG